MKLSREGDSLVSTPVFIGHDEDMQKAVQCAHEFEPAGAPVRDGPGKRAFLQREHCKKCIGMRVRVTPAEGATIQELLEGWVP